MRSRSDSMAMNLLPLLIASDLSVWNSLFEFRSSPSVPLQIGHLLPLDIGSTLTL